MATWGWYVPAYFLVGWTVAGAYITATLADIVGRRDDRGYVRAGRLVALLGLFAGLASLVEILHMWGRHRPGFRVISTILRPISWFGVPPAWYVGSYTGLLLSTTNVPLRARNRRLLSSLFFSSAMSSGVAATTLATRVLPGVASSGTPTDPRPVVGAVPAGGCRRRNH